MSIGRLIVDFEARTGKFETDTDRARKTAEKRAKQIDKAFSDAGRKIGLALAAGTTAAAAALTALTKKSIDSADRLAKLSQQVGVSVESLGRLEFAAGLSGVETENLSTSLIKLNRSISEAAQGTAAQADAFAALGVSATSADGSLRPTEEVLNDLADSFSQAEDGVGKTAAAVEIFGRSGAQLIPLLNSGSAGLREMGLEAEQLGLVIDTETAKAAERFNDNLSRLGSIVDGVGNKLASEFVDDLEQASQYLIDTAKDGEALTQAAEGISTAIKGAGLVLIGFSNTLQIVGKSFAGIAAAAVSLGSGNFRGALEALEASGDDIIADVEDIRKAYEGLFGEIEDGADETEKLGKESEETGKKVIAFQGKAEGASKKATDALKEQAKAAEELGRAMQEIADSLSSAEFDISDQIAQQERYNELLREGVSVESANRIIEREFAEVRSNELDTMREKLDILRQQGDQLEEALKLEKEIAEEEKRATEEAAEKLADELRQKGQGISDAIADAIINGGANSADDLIDLLGNALKAEVFQVTLEPLLDGFAEAIGGVLSKQIPGLGTSFGQAAGLAFAGFQAFDFARSLRPENSALSADAFGVLGTANPFTMALAGLDSLTGGSVFGGKWKTDDLRLLGELTNGTFEGFLQQYTSKKLSAGRGTRRRNFEVEAPEFIDEIAAMFEASFANATRAADALSVSVGEFAYSLDESIIGLEGADLTARIEEIIGGAADALASQTLPGIEAFQAEGENLGQTLNRVASAAMATQDGLDLISQSLDLTGLALVDASQDLAGLFGGIENLGSALSGYYGAFFTAQEREQRLIESLTESFDDLGYVLPDTRDGFRDIVEGLNLTEEAGRDAFASLLGLSDGLDEVLTAAEVRADAAAQKLAEDAEKEAADAAELAALTQSLSIELMEAEGDALGALAARRQIELDALDESLRPMQERINALNDEAEAAALAVIKADKKAQLDREIAAEGAGLQRQLLELQGDTAAIRAIERAALFEANRELYDRINALRDEQAAAQDAARAAEELTRAQEQAMAEAGRLAEQQLQQARDNLGKAFASEISGLQGIVNAVGEAEGRLSQARSDLSSAYQREAGEIEATISRFEALADALNDFQSEVGRTIAVTQGGALAAARARFEATARQARLGNENALGALPDAGRDFAAQLQSTAANRVELIRGLVGIQREAAAAENVANRQKTIAEQQLEALNRQVERFGILNDSVLSVAEATSMVVQAEQASRFAEQQAEEAQAQIEEMERQRDQLLNIDNSVLSVHAAITALQIAEAANAALIASAVSSGLAAAASIAASAARSIPGLAGGGYANGLTWVGERGPELINASNGRVYSNSESMSMAATIGANDSDMKAMVRQNLVVTSKLLSINRRWDVNGLPETRSVA